MSLSGPPDRILLPGVEPRDAASHLCYSLVICLRHEVGKLLTTIDGIGGRTAGFVNSRTLALTQSTLTALCGQRAKALGPIALSSTPRIRSPPSVLARQTVASAISWESYRSSLHQILNSSCCDSNSAADVTLSWSKIDSTRRARGSIC